MPVIERHRLALRGKIRAQIRYEVLLLNRLLVAYSKNNKLPVFAPGSGFASVTQATAFVNWWLAALLATE